MRYVSGQDEAGKAIDVRDPLSARFAAVAAEAGGDAGRLADGLLAIREVFGTDLPADPRFTGPVREALASLYRQGAAATVDAAVAQA